MVNDKICIGFLTHKFSKCLQVFLDTIRKTERIRSSRGTTIDPRSAARTPAANRLIFINIRIMIMIIIIRIMIMIIIIRIMIMIRIYLCYRMPKYRNTSKNLCYRMPKYRLRYDSPAWASPSRDTLHARLYVIYKPSLK